MAAHASAVRARKTNIFCSDSLFFSNAVLGGHHGRPQDIFSGVGKLGDPETKVPQWGPGMDPCLRQIVKIMHE